MTRTQKIQLRQSEIRESMAALLDKAERSDDDARLLKDFGIELRQAEADLQSALLAEPEPDPEIERREHLDAEAREKRSLLERASIGRYLRASIEGRMPSGIEGEASLAHGVPVDAIPLEKFALGDVETRAATPAPTETPSRYGAIVPSLFAESLATFAGVSMPTVPSGIASYPVIATNLTAGPKAKGVTSDETAGAFTVTNTSPRRVTGSFRLRQEDLAVLPEMDIALENNLRQVLANAVNVQMLTGDGTAPNVNGLLQRLDDPDAPATGVETFSRFVSSFAGTVDGLFAQEPQHVRVLVGPATIQLMLSVFQESGGPSAYSYSTGANGQFGGVRVSPHIAAASHVESCVYIRRNPAGDAAAVMPVWGANGVTFIRDVYSGAGKGEVTVSALIMVGNVVVLRSGVYKKGAFRVSE